MRRWPARSRSAMPPRSSERIGRKPTDGELYMAHFFGTGGAGQLINAAQRQAASQRRRRCFRPRRAPTSSIFYDRQGNARSVAGVYAELNRRYQVARANVLPGRRADGGRRQHAGARPAAPTRRRRRCRIPPGTTSAFAVGFRAAGRGEPPSRRSGRCFSTAGVAATGAARCRRSSPSCGARRRFAGRPSRQRSDRDRPGGDAPAAPEPLDLFRDMRPDVRSLFRGNGRA